MTTPLDDADEFEYVPPDEDDMDDEYPDEEPEDH